MLPILLIAGGAGLLLLMLKKPTTTGVLRPGEAIPPNAQPVPTVRDDQGRVLPQPNVVTDPTNGQSFYVPPPPSQRPATDAKLAAAAIMKPTIADPATFKPDIARQLALTASQDVRTKGTNYSRDVMKAFQSAAGLKPDGFYAGRTRGALIWYGVTDAPPTVYQPHTTVPYTPAPVPGATVNPAAVPIMGPPAPAPSLIQSATSTVTDAAKHLADAPGAVFDKIKSLF